MIPLFLLANQALKDFGKFADTANTLQIRKISETYLLALTREKVEKFNQALSRYESCAEFMAMRAGEIYDMARPPAYDASATLIKSPENHIFYTSPSAHCLTAYWGGRKISPEIKKEINGLRQMDGFLEKTKALTGESIATHIITLSGIGKYCTPEWQDRVKYMELPRADEFDLRNSPSLAGFKKEINFCPRIVLPYDDPVQKEPIFTITAPILDKEGRLRGMAGIDIPVSGAIRRLNRGSTKERFCFVLGPGGEFSAFPPEYKALFITEASKGIAPGIQAMADRLLKDRLSVRMDLGKEPYLMTAAPFADDRHLLVEVISERQMLASVHKTRFALGKTLSMVSEKFLIYAGIALVLAGACIHIVVVTFVRPIRKLTRMTRKIAAKKYHYRSNLDRSDELGDLARALDLMARQLGQFQEQEKAYIEDLAGRTLQLKQLNEYLVYFEESERKAIASELHGSVAQTLGMGVSKIKSIIETCPGRQDLVEVKVFLEHSVTEVRTLMYELAPPILDDFDIDVAIEFLVEEINEKQHTHFDFTNVVGGQLSLNRAVKLTFYRAVKTILTNILECDRPPEARLKLTALRNLLCIRVDIPGLKIGLKQAVTLPGNIGNQDFSDRLERLGGRVNVVPGPDQGTRIILTAPVLSGLGQSPPI